MKIIISLFILMNLSLSYAGICPNDRKDLFCIPPEKILNSEMTINEFFNIPIKIFNLYKKDFDQLPYPVTLNAQWESPYFGAGVSLYENSYKLMVLGGMTRMPEMTLDAYAAIICHEIGHIIGGEPKQTIPIADWASAEGQADFFSASTCLPKYFKSEGMIDSELIQKRVEKAGYEFIHIASVIESVPKNKILKREAIKLPKVSETITNIYPTLQCRYETYRNPIKRSSCWFKE